LHVGPILYRRRHADGVNTADISYFPHVLVLVIGNGVFSHGDVMRERHMSFRLCRCAKAAPASMSGIDD
jgi:hypothetical protein